MDFSGYSWSFGYSEAFSQTLYVDFPCGFETNNMKNIEFTQGQSHKNWVRETRQMIILNLVWNCMQTHKYRCACENEAKREFLHWQ